MCRVKSNDIHPAVRSSSASAWLSLSVTEAWFLVSYSKTQNCPLLQLNNCGEQNNSIQKQPHWKPFLTVSNKQLDRFSLSTLLYSGQPDDSSQGGLGYDAVTIKLHIAVTYSHPGLFLTHTTCPVLRALLTLVTQGPRLMMGPSPLRLCVPHSWVKSSTSVLLWLLSAFVQKRHTPLPFTFYHPKPVTDHPTARSQGIVTFQVLGRGW